MLKNIAACIIAVAFVLLMVCFLNSYSSSQDHNLVQSDYSLLDTQPSVMGGGT